MSTKHSVEVFFVVDGVRLESQACLLASTLKRCLLHDQKAVAYVRQDYRGKLRSFTREILDVSGVELRDIPNTANGHAPWASSYPNGNKILAAAAPRMSSISVFLDTDTLLVSPLDFEASLGNATIGACVSDYAASAGSEDDWAAFYAAFDMKPPNERMQYNAGRRLVSFPYYNAGMVVFRETTEQGEPTHIGQDWLNAALHFEQQVEREYSRTNIDQFTLPIIGYKRGTPVVSLPQHMNFNLQCFGDDVSRQQSIVHYHQMGVLWKHHRHARFALDCLCAVRGDDAAQEFLSAFGATLNNRKRLKEFLQTMTSQN